MPLSFRGTTNSVAQMLRFAYDGHIYRFWGILKPVIKYSPLRVRLTGDRTPVWRAKCNSEIYPA